MISIFINYIDREILSVSAPLLAKELGLLPRDLGVIFSAFFWTYSISQILAGRLVTGTALNGSMPVDS
jgi:ACS family D-galactonate transporter-like MFS transporter